MRVWLKEWGPGQVVFGWEMGPHLGERDFIIDCTVGEISMEEPEFRAAAAAYFWFVPVACANEVDLHIDLPVMIGHERMPEALTSLWKALLYTNRQSEVTFSSIAYAPPERIKYETLQPQIEFERPSGAEFILPFSAGLDSCNVLRRLKADGVNPILMTVNNESVTKVWDRETDCRCVHFSSPHYYQLVPPELLEKAPQDSVTGYTWYSGFCPLAAPFPAIYIMTRPCQYHLWYRHLREFLVPAVNPAVIHLTSLNGYRPAYLFHYKDRESMWQAVAEEQPAWLNMIGMEHLPPPDGDGYKSKLAIFEIAAAGIAPDAMKWEEGWENNIPNMTPTLPDWWRTSENIELVKTNIRGTAKYFPATLKTKARWGSEESMEHLRQIIRDWIKTTAEFKKGHPDRWPDDLRPEDW